MSSDPPQTRTLLIVDDEPDILDAVERLFRKEYRVLSAQSVDKALSIVESETPQVVLSDQRMPSRSGVEFLAELRERHPEMVRVLLTGYSKIDHVIDAINEGHVYRYVSKPWEPAELKVTVEQCFEYWDARRERERLVEQLREANTQLEDRNRQLEQANEALALLESRRATGKVVVTP